MRHILIPTVGTALFHAAFFISPAVSNSVNDIEQPETFQVQNSAAGNALHITSNGNLGAGTETPQAALHILRTDASAQVFVEDLASANVTLFRLKSEQDTRFQMLSQGGAEIWTFRTSLNGGAFSINNPGSSGTEMRLFKGGDVEFNGDVTANGVLLTSSRDSKTDFAPLDVNDVLERLSQLEISQWRYKHESEDTVHFGPVAEEFHEIFGLSNGTHLNLVDTNGITFAAIQALHEDNKRLQKQNQTLLHRIEQLEENLIELFNHRDEVSKQRGQDTD